MEDKKQKTTRSNFTNVFKVKVKFKGMRKSTVIPNLNVIAYTLSEILQVKK